MFYFISILCASVSISYAQKIELKNNGYEGILIAISDNVPYNEDLIPNIKEVFNKASSKLYSVTKNRAYFREITILVPSNWSINASLSSTETFEKANIRVDLPSSQYGDNPWVSQPGGCGEPGEFMLITNNFLLDKATSARRWGPSEKVIVHEWGHLRWGLFDEYPLTDSISEHFYISPSTKGLEASRCNLKLLGGNRNRKSKGPCVIDPLTSLPENDCRFYPSSTQKSGASSIMYYQFLPQVMDFCDNDQLSPETLHNVEAPNRQNILCSMKSAWEVMRESVDFSKGANPSRNDSNFNTSVSFKVIKRRSEEKIVIVMDVSGSMRSNDYINKMASSVKHYLKYTVPTNSWVGLVKYSDTAQRITPELVKITGENTRDALVSMVNVTPDGHTAVGQGLQLAHQMLRESSTTTELGSVAGYRIVLLTDGEENRPPRIAVVKPKILNAGLIVDTILLGSEADRALISLAADTGGLTFYSSGSDTSTSLMDSYTAAEKSRSTNPLTTPITIISRVAIVQPSSSCFGVHVERSLGVDTTFTFNWLDTKNVHITIIAPNGLTKYAAITNGSSFGYKNNNSDEVGSWTVCMKTTDASIIYVTTQVDSTARGYSQAGLPITVRTTITNKNPSFRNESQPVTIYSTLSKGYAPVLYAKVTAFVESPVSNSSSKPFEIELRDDGSSADTQRDDGIYSGYLLNAAEIGKYTVTVTVVGTNDSKIKNANVYNRAPLITEPGDIISQDESKLTPTEEFQRHSLAGFIDVVSVADSSVDMYPPSRIKDLTVVEASYEAQRITFEWSAVGDDLDTGNASYYELWQAEDIKSLISSYLNASKVNDSEVIAGNLSKPLPPYSKEKLTIRATKKDEASVYAIIAKDKSGNASPISNIVSVKLVAPRTLMQRGESFSNVKLIVGVTLGVLAFGITIVSTIVIILTKSRNK